MTTLQELSKRIETLLNGVNDANILTYQLDKIHDNTVYKYAVFPSFTDYKKAEDIDGITYKYITICLCAGSGENSGVNEETYNSTQGVDMILLAPDAEDEINFIEGGQTKKIRFADLIIKMLNDLLAYPQSWYINDYFVTTSFSRVQDGIVDVRNMVGVSLSLTVYMTLSIVKGGVSSLDYKIFVGLGESTLQEVFPQRMTVYRQSLQDGNIPQDSMNGASLCTTKGTSLTISIDKPLQRDILDTFIAQYTNLGEHPTILVKLKLDEMEQELHMTIAEASLARQQNLAVSATVKLVEVFTHA